MYNSSPAWTRAVHRPALGGGSSKAAGTAARTVDESETSRRPCPREPSVNGVHIFHVASTCDVRFRPLRPYLVAKANLGLLTSPAGQSSL